MPAETQYGIRNRGELMDDDDTEDLDDELARAQARRDAGLLLFNAQLADPPPARPRRDPADAWQDALNRSVAWGQTES